MLNCDQRLYVDFYFSEKPMERPLSWDLCLPGLHHDPVQHSTFFPGLFHPEDPEEGCCFKRMAALKPTSAHFRGDGEQFAQLA